MVLEKFVCFRKLFLEVSVTGVLTFATVYSAIEGMNAFGMFHSIISQNKKH